MTYLSDKFALAFGGTVPRPPAQDDSPAKPRRRKKFTAKTSAVVTEAIARLNTRQRHRQNPRSGGSIIVRIRAGSYEAVCHAAGETFRVFGRSEGEVLERARRWRTSIMRGHAPCGCKDGDPNAS